MKNPEEKGRGRPKQTWRQLDKQAFRLLEQGRHDEAIRKAMSACQLASQQFGENHPDYANSLNNLACLYVAMRDYTTAEPFMRHALEIKRNVLGEEHLSYAEL